MTNNQAKRNISLYYASAFFGELRFIIPIFVAYQTQYITLSQLSLLAGLRYATTMILELPTGAFGDLVGRKISVALGSIIEAIALAMFAFVPSASIIIGATMVRAVGESFTSGSDTALVYDTLKEVGREREFSRVRAKNVLVTQMGLLTGTFLGGYLYMLWQGLPWLGVSLSLVVYAILWMFMTEPTVDTYTFSLASYVRHAIQGMKELFRSKLTTQLSLYYALVGGITWAWQVYFNLVYVATLGFPETVQGQLLSLARFVNVILIVKVLKVDNLVTKSSGLWFFPFLMLAAIALATISSIPFQVLAIFLLMLPSTLRYIILDKYTNSVFPSSHRATALSGLNMLMGFVYILYVVGTSTILNVYGIRAVHFIAGAFTLAVVLPLTVSLSARIARDGTGKEAKN